MEAKKCDRCNGFYEEDKERFVNDREFSKFTPIYTGKIIWFKSHKKDVRKSYFDLCPQCQEEFEQWLRMKGKII